MEEKAAEAAAVVTGTAAAEGTTAEEATAEVRTCVPDEIVIIIDVIIFWP